MTRFSDDVIVYLEQNLVFLINNNIFPPLCQIGSEIYKIY